MMQLVAHYVSQVWTPQKQNTHMKQIIADIFEVFTSDASVHIRSCSHNMVAASARLGFTLHSWV